MKVNSVAINCNNNINYQKQNIQIQPQFLKNNDVLPLCYMPAFGSTSKIKIAQRALDNLTTHFENGTQLSLKDEKWLAPLRKVLGAAKMLVADINDPAKEIAKDVSLTLEKINSQGSIKALKDALKVMLGATEYKPSKVKLQGVQYEVHNPQIAKLMRGDYSKEDFKKMVAYLNAHHLFDMSDNAQHSLVIDKQRGIVKTCGATENWEMSDRAWITDIMRVGDIQKRKSPKTWTQALETVAQYYQKQDENFKKLIENPEIYHNGGNMAGIAHIFMPKTLEPDENWFNNKRLESHGLALKEFCLGITDGMSKRQKHGFKSAEDVSENVLLAMDNLSKYFKAIKYYSAASAGNWEEIPLKGGLTSDTETIRSALCGYKELLYSPKYSKNAEIQKIRTRMAKYNPISQKELEELIATGEKRVRATYLEEAPSIRPKDASLVFITTSDIKLADTVVEDVKKHVEILTSLEKNLVRENGIIRYAPFKFALKDGTYATSPDSYLNLNYFNAVDKNGKLNLDWKNIVDGFASKDCSEPELFFARSKLSTPNKEAQWFMVSEMSTGYGKQIEKLLKNAKSQNRDLSDEEKELVKFLKTKQTQFLNKALARISAEEPAKIHQIKANGLEMPAVSVSEAHQYVSDIYGKTKMMQGTNAPLAWAVASLYKAISEEALILNLLK